MAVDMISMVHMAVTDAERSKKFYTDVLGFKVAKDFSQGEDRWIQLIPPGSNVMLNLTTVHETMRRGTMKLSLSPSNIKETFSKLKKKTPEPLGEIFHHDW